MNINSWRTWIKRTFAALRKGAKSKGKPYRRGFPLCVETLEDRVTPTVFSNPASITLPTAVAQFDPAGTYPSNISVSGLSGSLDHVAVTLSNVSYDFSTDVDALLVSPTGQTFIFMGDIGSDSGTYPTETGFNNVTLTFDDNAAAQAPGQATTTGIGNANGSVSFKPTNQTDSDGDVFGSPAPAGPYGQAGPTGADTFASVFNGVAPNGTWSLYITIDTIGDGPGQIAGGWSLDITTVPAVVTTTAVTTSAPGGAFTTAPNNQVTLTATVSSSSAVNEGTVTFVDTTTNTTLASNVAVTGGQAQATNITFTDEGNHSIRATYSGTVNFGTSHGSVTQEVNNHTTVVANNFSNTGAITINDNNLNSGVATPYPSKIFISGLTGTLTDLNVTLHGVSDAFADDLDILLVGPGGQKLILVSDAGLGATINNVTITFDDQAASGLSQTDPWAADNASASYQPTNFDDGADTFPSPAPGSPASPGPTGSDTLASIFNGIDPNGTWSLYVVDDSGGGGNGSIAAGWTLTLTSIHTPSVTNSSTNEDTQTTTGLAISRNNLDGAEVTHFKITNIANGTLFQNNGTTPINNGDFITYAQGNAGLKFTPSANFFGSGTFDVQSSASNSNSGLGGGIATATITVNPVADTPSVTNAMTFVSTQTTSGLVISRNAVDGAEVAFFKITNIQNGTLFQNNGTTPINNGDFITFAQGNAGLKFTPAANLTSPGTTFSFNVAGAITNTGVGLSPAATASITVQPNPIVSFAAFTAELEIKNKKFDLDAAFTLGAGNNGIAPLTEQMILQFGTLSFTIPAGAFHQVNATLFEFDGTISGFSLEVSLRSLGNGRYSLQVDGKGVKINETANPIYVSLTIGNDTGLTAAQTD